MSESSTIVITTIGTGVALGALLIGLVLDQNLRIDGLRSDLTGRIDGLRSDLTGRIDDVKTDIRDMRTQLRNVEVAFGKVDQRLLTLERVIIPSAEPPE